MLKLPRKPRQCSRLEIEQGVPENSFHNDEKCVTGLKDSLCEGLTRCWLLNAGPGREDCTACGVTGQGEGLARPNG